MTLREFSIEDIDSAIEFWARIPGLGLSEADEPNQLKTFLMRNPKTSFIVTQENDSKPLATILAGHDGRRGFLYHLAVDPQYRDLGWGKRLIERALAALKTQGIRKVHVFVFESNEIGKGFWHKWGGGNGWVERSDILVFSASLPKT